MMEKPCLVVDIGSAYCKAGWNGGNSPSLRVPSVVAYLPFSEDTRPRSMQLKPVIGSSNLSIIKELPTEFVISRGAITNWDAMEFMWHYIFDELNNKPNDHPILITGLLPKDEQSRQRITEIMMETFNVPSLHIGNQAELALFGAGLLTGTVLECGAGLTHIAPIFGGQVISNSAIICELGGLDISLLLYKSLINKEAEMKHFVQREAMEDLKEKFCYVNKTPIQEESSSNTNSTEVRFSVLPDGQVVSLTEKHLTYPNVLFKPSQFDLPGEELSDQILKSALSSGWNFKSIFSNVVLSGGSTLFDGFPERLFRDLCRIRPGFRSSEVISWPNRIDLPWIGGSILSCLSSFKSCCITREKYNEEGKDAVQ
ncbi:actin-6-like [Sminthopsis crassicaudata]|uniref:actin-6-like n=1 Tax=Sminthopsis crassicaudata TaxID=9301 RepID=UPI003D68B356